MIAQEASRRRETRLWYWVIGLLTGFYAAIHWGQVLVLALRERNLLRWTLSALFAVVACAIVVAAIRQRPGPREVVWLSALGASVGVLVAWIENPQERLHFLQYGAVSWLCLEALRERLGRRRDQPLSPTDPAWRTAVWASLLAGLAGWVDEGIQALTPSRVYDLRDVAMNALGGFLVAFGSAVRRWVRGFDRARGEEGR